MSLLAYAITCLLAGCFSAKLIYHPHPISTEEALAKGPPAEESEEEAESEDEGEEICLPGGTASATAAAST